MSVWGLLILSCCHFNVKQSHFNSSHDDNEETSLSTSEEYIFSAFKTFFGVIATESEWETQADSTRNTKLHQFCSRFRSSGLRSDCECWLVQTCSNNSCCSRRGNSFCLLLTRAVPNNSSWKIKCGLHEETLGWTDFVGVGCAGKSVLIKHHRWMCECCLNVSESVTLFLEECEWKCGVIQIPWSLRRHLAKPVNTAGSRSQLDRGRCSQLL